MLGAPPRPTPGAARPGRLRGPGHADATPALSRGRPPADAARGSTRAGTTQLARAPDRASSASTPDQRAGQLSGGQRAQLALTLAIAKRPELLRPRRAGGEPRPAGPARVPAEPHGGRGRGRDQRGRSRRTWSPTSSGSATTWSSWPPRGSRWPATIDELLATHRRLIGPRHDPAALPARPGGHRGQPHRPPEHAARAHRRTRSSIRPGRSRPLGLEDLVLAYMRQAAATDVAARYRRGTWRWSMIRLRLRVSSAPRRLVAFGRRWSSLAGRSPVTGPAPASTSTTPTVAACQTARDCAPTGD